jgi:hypothetical protein
MYIIPLLTGFMAERGFEELWHYEMLVTFDDITCQVPFQALSSKFDPENALNVATVASEAPLANSAEGRVTV